MSARLTTGHFINAMLRTASQAGGHITVVTHGDHDAGGLLLICAEKGRIVAILERSTDENGHAIWRPCFGQPIENKDKIMSYLHSRALNDADLWQVELDIAQPERFAAQFIDRG